MAQIKNAIKGFDILGKLTREEVSILSQFYDNEKLVDVFLKIGEIIKLKDINKFISSNTGLDSAGLLELAIRKEVLKTKKDFVEELIELSRKAKNYTNS